MDLFYRNPPLEWMASRRSAALRVVGGHRIPNERWRSFAVSVSKQQFAQGVRPSRKDYALSQTGMQAIFSVLGSFYAFLIEEYVTEVNPVASIRQKSQYIQKQQHKTPVRRLSNLQKDILISTAQKLAQQNPTDYERSLFVICAKRLDIYT